MIDDDDALLTALVWPSGGGWIVALLGLIAVVALLLVARANRIECEAQHCDHGAPELLHGRCVCVEKAGAE